MCQLSIIYIIYIYLLLYIYIYLLLYIYTYIVFKDIIVTFHFPYRIDTYYRIFRYLEHIQPMSYESSIKEFVD